MVNDFQKMEDVGGEEDFQVDLSRFKPQSVHIDSVNYLEESVLNEVKKGKVSPGRKPKENTKQKNEI